MNRLLLFFLICVAYVPATGQCITTNSSELVINGNFSAGNTGFTSAYTYVVAGPGVLEPTNVYSITTDPFICHPGAVSYHDHTTGNGNMFAANGASTPIDLWCETVTVRPNTSYNFSAWFADWSGDSTDNLPEIQFTVNGIVISTAFNFGYHDAVWMQFSSSWYSGNNTSATICINDQQTAGYGNDFSIDDISFKACGCGATSTITAIPDTICPGSSAILSTSGGTGYSWSPSVNLSCDTCSNPVADPIVTTTYILTVSNGSCSSTDSLVVTVLGKVQAGTVTGNPDTLCTGGASQLTVNGTAGNIQWQSSSDGISFTNLSGDTFKVFNTGNLTQTTYYRVQTSGSCGIDSSLAAAINVLSIPNIGGITANPPAICSGQTFRLNLTGITVPVLWQQSNSPGNFTNITGVDSSVYTTPPLSQSLSVRAIVNNGFCADTSATVVLEVYPPPVAPALSTADSLICSDDSTRINTSGSYSTYRWNNGDRRPYTYANLAGGYWVTVTDVNGCSAVSPHQDITVFLVPSVSIVVEGDTLSSFGANSYQWYFNNSPIPGDTGPMIIAAQPGLYAVQITDNNGCPALSNNTPIVIDATGNMVADKELIVYPNPFNNTVLIEMNDPEIKIKQVEIYDVSGRNVVIANYAASPVSCLKLDVTRLPAGSYYLKIGTDKNEFIKNIIK